MGSSSAPAAAAAAAPSRRKVALYLALLTLQYGAQPLISKRFVREDTIVTSLVLATEAAKVICAIILLIAEGSLKKQFSNWTLTGSLTASGLPAAIYALQNSLLQVSYKHLDSLTFSILNQTKLLWTAFFTFLILGQKQSSRQVLALALLIGAAVLLSVGESSSKGSKGGGSDYILLYGIIPVTVASVLSGLASSLCQWASQVGLPNLVTFQNAVYDGEAIRKYGFFHEWTFWTVGFVIVSALLVTALLQFIFDGKPPSLYCLIALPLVASSIFIYQKHPYVDRKKKD
ncbi:Nucleotide-sugar transporter/ sugar porter [Zea mays]|uniref:Nucleotide-sugar transporter/ sugar porter n=1 Tax=Zea mays TaxID=4577 RepID=A0A1D6HB75_MAIZE|nr:Nucleotide-sugar transporter/ sugar porter [Zea mays]AQK71954.1 Nucleotide-sugar transporter/ sugar porter [Zea mays]